MESTVLVSVQDDQVQAAFWDPGNVSFGTQGTSKRGFSKNSMGINGLLFPSSLVQRRAKCRPTPWLSSTQWGLHSKSNFQRIAWLCNGFCSEPSAHTHASCYKASLLCIRNSLMAQTTRLIYLRLSNFHFQPWIKYGLQSMCMKACMRECFPSFLPVE